MNNNIFYTIKDISNDFKLNETEVRRVVAKLKHYLEPHIKRGSKNRLLLDPDALIVFQEIKKIIDLEENFEEAIRKVEENLKEAAIQRQSNQTESQRLNKDGTSQIDLNHELKQKVDSLQDQLLRSEKEKLEIEKEKVALDKKLFQFQQVILLLTGQCDPQRAQETERQRQFEEKRKVELWNKYTSYSFWRFRKKTKIKKELDMLINNWPHQ